MKKKQHFATMTFDEMLGVAKHFTFGKRRKTKTKKFIKAKGCSCGSCGKEYTNKSYTIKGGKESCPAYQYAIND